MENRSGGSIKFYTPIRIEKHDFVYIFFRHKLFVLFRRDYDKATRSFDPAYTKSRKHMQKLRSQTLVNE